MPPDLALINLLGIYYIEKAIQYQSSGNSAEIGSLIFFHFMATEFQAPAS